MDLPLKTPLRNEKRQKLTVILDCLGLGLIGLLSLGYVVYKSNFAELHVALPGLDFPIFVGEIVLASCLLVCGIKYVLCPFKLGKRHFVLALLGAFVLIKAGTGYMEWGALALRNAALFYYMSFAVIGYYLYDRKYISLPVTLAIVIAVCVIFHIRVYHFAWTLTAFLLSVLLVRTIKNPMLKILMALALLVVTPYVNFFGVARMIIIGNFLAGAYVIFSLLCIFKTTVTKKVIIGVVGLIGLMVTVIQVSNPNELASMINIRKVQDIYHYHNNRYLDKRDETHDAEVYPVRIFAPNKEDFGKYIDKKQAYVTDGKDNSEKASFLSTMKSSTQKVTKSKTKEQSGGVSPRLSVKSEYQKLKKGKKVRELVVRDRDGNVLRRHSVKGLATYNNAIYRVLVWQDVIDELNEFRPLLGMDFGRPFISKRIRTLRWSLQQLERDGWTPVHNSLLHIIYRAGLVGISLIVAMIYMLGKMCWTAVKRKSVTGILLCAILLQWTVAMNFLLTLELPYTAIPIWTLFGMTWAFFFKVPSRSLKKEDIIQAEKPAAEEVVV